MDGNIDTNAGGTGKTVALDVGAGLGFLLGLNRTRAGAMSALRRTSSSPLQLRRSAGGVRMETARAHGLPFALGLSPSLLASARPGDSTATAHSMPAPRGRGEPPPPTPRALSPTAPALSWKTPAALPATPAAPAAAPPAMTGSPRVAPRVSAEALPRLDTRAGRPGGETLPGKSLAHGEARSGAPVADLSSISAIRARVAAIAPLWWSLQVTAADPGRGAPWPPMAATPARSAPDYTLSAMILPMRASLGTLSPGPPPPSNDLHTPAAPPGAPLSATPEGRIAADLVERRVVGGALPLAALPVLAAPLRRWVTGEVTQQVARAAEHRPPSPPTPVDVSSDDFVRRLLAKMRVIVQEERFRSGLLR